MIKALMIAVTVGIMLFLLLGTVSCKSDIKKEIDDYALVNLRYGCILGTLRLYETEYKDMSLGTRVDMINYCNGLQLVDLENK